MRRFDNGQKKFLTLLIIWIIVSVAAVAATLLPELQVYIKMILWGYALLSVIFFIVAFVISKKLFHDAGVMESQFELLSTKGSTGVSNDEIINRAKLEAEDNNDEVKKEKARQEKLLKAKREAEENKQLDQLAEQISADLDQTADINEYFDKLLSNLAKVFDIVQGVAYALNPKTDKFEIKSTYAYYTPDTDRTFELGEGINGQVAKDKKTLELDNIPENYIQVVVSGLGQGSPKHLIFIPFVSGKQTVALVELATFEKKNYNMRLLSEKVNKRISKHISDGINLTAE